MGSRIRSASSVPVGALTEADFNKAFEDTKPTQVKTTKEFLAKLEECNKTLLNASVDWNRKSVTLSQLRGLLKADIPNPVNLMIENGSLWERCLVEGMKELRSTLSRDYCITVAYFAKCMGANFFKQTNLLLENLMNLSQNSARIMSSSAIMAAEFIAKYVQNPKLVNAVSAFTTSKAVAIRRNVVTMCKQILVYWSSDLIESQNVTKILMEIVKSGCCDADLQCRQLAKEAYFSLAEKFPDQANIVYESLDPQKQKMINDVYRSAASSTHSIVHERLDNAMGQRLQAQQNQFLTNRSHSDVHFRHNVNKTPLKPNIHIPKGRAKSPVRMTPLKPRTTPAKLPTNGYAATSTLRNIRPTNGNAESVSQNPVASVFGPMKPISRMQYNPPTMLGRAPATPASRVMRAPLTKTPMGIKPNIRPPTVVQASVSSIPISLSEQVPRKEINPDVPDLSEITISGEKYVENTFNEIITDLTEVVRKITSNMDNYVPALTAVFSSIKKLIVQKDEISINNRHWLPILLLLSKVFRQAHVPADFRIEALDCAKNIIEMDPLCLGDKHEFLIIGILEAFDRKNIALYRAAEDCALAVIKPMSVNQAKDLLLPLIEPGTEGDDIKPEAIAGAVKLLTASVKEAKLQVVNDLFNEISPQILNCFNHPEPIVRRAVVMYYVSIAKIIGLERVTSKLPTGVVKLVNVYYDKVNQHSLV
uniref:CLASP N-terminal domain-containing protein n=1 Tax=Panagrolaimus sp. JU765 TaxID=591449 RepID=A0AC34RIC2_9BILA